MTFSFRLTFTLRVQLEWLAARRLVWPSIALAAPAAALLMVGRTTPVTDALAPMGVLLALIGIGPIGLFLFAALARRSDPLSGAEISVTLGESGVDVATPRSLDHARWEELSDLKETGQFLLLFTRHLWLAIPKSAFVTPEQCEAVAEHLRAHIRPIGGASVARSGGNTRRENTPTSLSPRSPDAVARAVVRWRKGRRLQLSLAMARHRPMGTSIVLGGFLLFLVVSGLPFWKSLLAFVIGYSLLVVVVGRRRERIEMAALERMPKVIELTRSGVRTSSPEGTNEQQWSFFTEAAETHDFFLLFSGHRAPTVIPKDSLDSAEDCASVRALLKQHVEHERR